MTKAFTGTYTRSFTCLAVPEALAQGGSEIQQGCLDTVLGKCTQGDAHERAQALSSLANLCTQDVKVRSQLERVKAGSLLSPLLSDSEEAVRVQASRLFASMQVQ